MLCSKPTQRLSIILRLKLPGYIRQMNIKGNTSPYLNHLSKTYQNCDPSSEPSPEMIQIRGHNKGLVDSSNMMSKISKINSLFSKLDKALIPVSTPL